MYKELRDSTPFSSLKFLIVIIVSITYSSALFYVPIYSFSTVSITSNGESVSLWDCSLCTYYSLVICGTVIILEDMLYYNVFSIKMFALHLLFNTVLYYIYDLLNTGYMVSGITGDSIGCIKFWAIVLCTSSVALVPFIIFRKMQDFYGNSIVGNLRSRNYHSDYQMKKYKKHLEELSKYNRSIAKFKRVFKRDNFEADNFGDKKMKELVQNYKQVKKRTSHF